MDHQNDSFGLFADVLAGTLGIVALIALLMVLAAGDWHVTPESVHRDELRSGALPEQVRAAKRRAAQSGESLGSEVARIAPLVGVPPERLIKLAQAEAAARDERLAAARVAGANAAVLRRENLRLGQRVADLTIMKDALDVMVADLRDRPHPRTAERLVEPTLPLRVLREGRESPKPFYLICRAGKIYAPYLFGSGAYLQLNRQDVSWIVLQEGRRSRCLPLPERGWNLEEASERLKTLGPELARRRDYYAVVLAFPDSFWEARELLRLLDGADLSFSWRPYPAGDAVDFAVDGAIPPPPL